MGQIFAGVDMLLVGGVEMYLLGIKATGLTLSEDPMTISRSHSSLSAAIWLWNSSGKLSPKNTISGFITASGVSAGHWGHSGKD